METEKSRPIGVVVFVCAVAIAVAALIYLRVSGLPGGTNEADAKKQVEAEIARIKARGEPVSADDLRGPAIPDSENGAVVYARAFELAEGLKNDMGDSAFGPLTSADPKGRTPELMTRARALVDKYKSVVPIIEEAVARPKCRFPFKWEDGIDALFREPGELRRLARFLSIKSVIDAEAGRKQEALHSVELILGMSNSLNEEPATICQLVRVALVSIAQQSLVRVAEMGPIDEKEGKPLHEFMSQMDFTKSVATGLYSVRVQCIQVFEEYRDKGKIPAGWLSLTPAWAKQFLYQDVLYSLKQLDKFIADGDVPYRTLAPNVPKPLVAPQVPEGYTLSEITVSGQGSFNKARDQGLARLALCHALLSLEAYKSKHGEYPATLAEASRDTGLSIPDDPFSGKSLVYRKQGKGCIVYSVDQDLKDNGGVGPKEYRGPVPRIPPALFNSKPGEMPNIPPPPTEWEQMEAERNNRDIVVKLDR